MTAPLYGLVLAGGASTRMHSDKAALVYHDRPQLDWTMQLAAGVCRRSFVSVRAEQARDPLRGAHEQIVDRVPAASPAMGGPLVGILSALETHPEAAWLVLACDLPFVDRATLDHLVANRDPQRVATAYRSSHDGLPEPLCAIFEPRALEPMREFAAQGRHCPRKFLSHAQAHLLNLPDPRALDNVNTVDERAQALRTLAG